MDKELEIYQINLHKAYAPTTELNNFLRRKSSFLAMLQEPVVRSGTIKNLDMRHGHIIQVGGNVKPRAAIYHSKNLIIHPLYHLSTADQAVAMLSVKINGANKDIIICSSYFPSDSVLNPPTQEFINVVDYCKNNNFSLLTSIDANAHHLAWGSTNSNPRGENLFEFILACY